METPNILRYHDFERRQAELLTRTRGVETPEEDDLLSEADSIWYAMTEEERQYLHGHRSPHVETIHYWRDVTWGRLPDTDSPEMIAYRAYMVGYQERLEAATDEEKKALRAERTRLYAQIPGTERHKEDRADRLKYFVPDNRVGEPRVEVSPCGRYRLTVESYKTEPGAWAYTKGTVETVEGEHIETIYNNYHSFWHCWVPYFTGDVYLLCGEDYQGYSCIDLKRKETRHRLPIEEVFGGGFCFADVKASPDGRTIYVNGCIWAGPYEIRIYEFNPYGQPLLYIGDAELNASLYEWSEEHGTYMVGTEKRVRRSDGANVDTLWKKIPDNEWGDLHNNDEVGETIVDKKPAVIPDPAAWYQERAKWYVERQSSSFWAGIPLDEARGELECLWNRIPEESRGSLTPVHLGTTHASDPSSTPPRP